MAAALPFLQTVAAGLGAVNAINSMVNRPRALSWEEATDQASQVLNPMFDQHIQDNLRSLDQASIARGFYGQMPADALRGERASQIEAARAAQIAGLADQMRGQSQQAALQAAQQAQQALQQQFTNWMNQNVFDLNKWQQQFTNWMNKNVFDLNKWATQAQVTGIIPNTGKPTFPVQQQMHNYALNNMAQRGQASFNPGGAQVGWGVGAGNVPVVRPPLTGAISGAIMRNWTH